MSGNRRRRPFANLDQNSPDRRRQRVRESSSSEGSENSPNSHITPDQPRNVGNRRIAVPGLSLNDEEISPTDRLRHVPDQMRRLSDILFSQLFTAPLPAAPPLITRLNSIDISSGPEDDCSICHDSLSGLPVIQHECGNYFHRDCINRLQSTAAVYRNNCPICRGRLFGKRKNRKSSKRSTKPSKRSIKRSKKRSIKPSKRSKKRSAR